MAHLPVILIADDDPDVVRQLEAALKPFLGDMEYCTANSGFEAVRLASMQLPNLVLLDHDMPAMDGLVACRELRKLHPDHDMAIWIITGHSDDLGMSAVMQFGADFLIRKPIHMRSLREMISNYLQLNLPESRQHAA